MYYIMFVCVSLFMCFQFMLPYDTICICIRHRKASKNASRPHNHSPAKRMKMDWIHGLKQPSLCQSAPLTCGGKSLEGSGRIPNAISKAPTLMGGISWLRVTRPSTRPPNPRSRCAALGAESCSPKRENLQYLGEVSRSYGNLWKNNGKEMERDKKKWAFVLGILI